jgi:hypothetical protein
MSTSAPPRDLPAPPRRKRRARPVAAGVAACGLAAWGIVAITSDGNTLDVLGAANIFGAGREAPPQPGGGGAGVEPPMWEIPEGTDRVLTFPEVTGRVNPDTSQPDFVGPEGDGGQFGMTDVRSFGGISGVVHQEAGSFVVGVLLTDAPPQDPAPERLDVTDQAAAGSVQPEIGQTFLIGDGTDLRVQVPDEATRLFVGFADGYYYKGQPGWYDNNSGRVEVTVELVEE